MWPSSVAELFTECCVLDVPRGFPTLYYPLLFLRCRLAPLREWLHFSKLREISGESRVYAPYYFCAQITTLGDFWVGHWISSTLSTSSSLAYSTSLSHRKCFWLSKSRLAGSRPCSCSVTSSMGQIDRSNWCRRVCLLRRTAKFNVSLSRRSFVTLALVRLSNVIRSTFACNWIGASDGDSGGEKSGLLAGEWVGAYWGVAI